MFERRSEQRRLRHQERARADGDLDAPVMWLLPSHGRLQLPRRPGWRESGREFASKLTRWRVDVSEERGGSIFTRRYDGAWRCEGAFVSRRRPRLIAFPPAFEARLDALSDFYAFGEDRWDAGRAAGTFAREPAPDADPVAAERSDLERWYDATEAYLAELYAAQEGLVSYWAEHGHKLHLPWRRGSARRWRATLEAAYERLTAAAERYRPVLDEITGTIPVTVRAQAQLDVRMRRFYDWEERPLWRLAPADEDGFLLVRSDVAAAQAAPTATPAATPRPLWMAFEAARHELSWNLLPVDWDEASIRACDAELAAIFGDDGPIGRTRSGRPMVGAAPSSFAGWFRQRFGRNHDLADDRARLERRRAERAAARRVDSDGRRHVGGSWPTAPGVGGSWPTDPGVGGHFGGHDAGGYGGHDGGGYGHFGGHYGV